MFLMQGTQKLPIFTSTCFLLPLLLLCLCVQNESLQGVFSADQAETPIHQTGMCVLSLLTERMRGGGERLVSYFSSVWASLQAFIPSPAILSPTYEAWGWWGGAAESLSD